MKKRELLIGAGALALAGRGHAARADAFSSIAPYSLPQNPPVLRPLYAPKLRYIGNPRTMCGGNFSAVGGGSNTTQRSRVQCTIGAYPVTGVSVDYGNWGMNAGTANTAGANIFTLTASLEYPLGTIIGAFTWAGASSLSVATNATAQSDILPCFIPAGGVAYIRTFCSFSAAGTVPSGFLPIQTSFPNERTQVGVGLTDNTLIAADPYTGGGFSASAGPTAIYGYAANPGPGALCFGDSLIFGRGDDPTGALALPTGDGQGNYGPYQRALSAVGICMARYVKTGVMANSEIGSTAGTQWLPVLKGGTTAIVQLGTNDLSANFTAAQTIGFLTEIYARISSQGLRVVPCTIPPRTTGTWSAGGGVGQSIFLPSSNTGAFQPGGSSDRGLLNAWIRSTPTLFPFVPGIIDGADAVETFRDSGFWQGGTWTGDGTHWMQGQGLTAVQAQVAQAIAGGMIA